MTRSHSPGQVIASKDWRGFQSSPLLRRGSLLLCFATALGACAESQAVVPNAPEAGQHVHSDSSDSPQRDMSPSSGSSAQLKDAVGMAQRGDFQNAERSIRTYLSDHADSADGHFLLGYVLYREAKPTDSLAEYTAGARFRRPSANDLATVAMDYVLLHDYPDADKWMTQATAQEPGNALYWYYLGRTKYNLNRFQEAVDAFSRCLKLRPDDVRAEYNLGLSYEGQALDNKAQAAYETAIAWQKDKAHQDPQPYLDLGTLLAKHGHPEQALPHLQKAIELDAHNPKMREEVGRVYEQLHDLAKAQLELETAVALAPNVAPLHFELGRIYQKEGMVARAKSEFARWTALNGTVSTDSAETPNPDVPR